MSDARTCAHGLDHVSCGLCRELCRHELRPDECSICKLDNRPRSSPMPVITGHPFEAQFPGWCSTCDERIEVGDEIRKVSYVGDPATYHHRRCATP